jgi:rRNA-processing protein FCF1
LVPDTNILLHHFDVLSQFIEDIEALSLPVIVIIPGVVIYELDGYVQYHRIALWMTAKYYMLICATGKRTAMAQRGLKDAPPPGFWKR